MIALLAAITGLAALSACGSDATTAAETPDPLPWHFLASTQSSDSVVGSTPDSSLVVTSMDVLLSEGGDFRMITSYDVNTVPQVGKLARTIRAYADTTHWQYTLSDSALTLRRDVDPSGITTDIVRPVSQPLQGFSFVRRWRVWNGPILAATLTARRAK